MLDIERDVNPAGRRATLARPRPAPYRGEDLNLPQAASAPSSAAPTDMAFEAATLRPYLL